MNYPLPTSQFNYYSDTTKITLIFFTFSKIYLINTAFAISYSSDLVSPNPGQSIYNILLISSYTFRH